MERDKPLLTVDKVAEILGVDRETVVRWIRRGRLAAVVLPGGRRYRIRRQDLDAALRPAPKRPGGRP
jgi:excisionase family DNA binding protein